MNNDEFIKKPVLKLGKMTGQELAEWFGVQYNPTYRKNPKKYLEILSQFCLHTPVYGGTIIKEIYLFYYVKGIGSIDDKNFFKIIKKCIMLQNGLATISGIVAMLKNTPEYSGYTDSQIYYRLRKSGIRLFGEMNGLNSEGPVGIRQYCWVVKQDELGPNRYRYFTEFEKLDFDDLTSKFYNKKTPEEIQKLGLLGYAFEKGEITAKQYHDEKEKIEGNFYWEVVIPFAEKHGIIVVRGTEYQITNENPKFL